LAGALALPIALGTAVGTLDWPGRAFPGFFVMHNGVVPTVGLYRWSGLRSGVPFHARVLEVDGRPFEGQAEFYAHAARLPIGTPVRYMLVKDGPPFMRTVPTMRFGVRDYWLTVGLLAAFGFVSLGVGIAVGLLQPRNPAARAFLVQGVLTGLFALTGAALYHPGQSRLSRLHFFTQAAFGAAFIHLGLVFPVERRFVMRNRLWIAVPYAIAVLLTAWVFVEFYGSPPRTRSLHATYLYSALSIMALIGLVAYAYWENRTPLVRPQLRSVLPGLVFGTVLGLVGFLNTARSGGDFPINLIAITPMLFYLAVGYAIARYDLFDIDSLVKQALVYGTLTLGITASYAGTIVLLGLFLPPQVVRASPLFNIAFVVAVASLFEPLRRGVQHVIDRTFFRARLDYRRTVSQLSSALTSFLDLDEILGRVGGTLSEGLQLRSLGVVLWFDEGTRTWRRRSGDGRMEEVPGAVYAALREALARAPNRPWAPPTAAWSSVVSQGEADGDLLAASRELAALDAVLLLPLALGGEVIGAFALGPKRSGLPFTGEDLELLGTLAAQSAIAVQNALSYRALQTLNADLEAKVHARTAELETSNTELGEAYRELQAAQAQLLHTEKMASLGQLVAGVAHEINNPVSFIVGNIDPLREKLDEIRALAIRHGDQRLGSLAARVSKMFDIIARGAERTASIVNDLRTFSRVGEALPKPTDLEEGIEVSLRLLQPRWAGRITIHRDYGALPRVEAVAGQLNQVFMNLLANACDAIPGAGNIWIRAASDGRQVTISVRDDGQGIAPEHRPRIFDPFFTTKPQGKGTGLGLAISHGIVTNHGGTIRVTSEAGGGTEFVIVLPVRLRAAAG
jgi:signal transduction histidine kinase